VGNVSGVREARNMQEFFLISKEIILWGLGFR
jgi:hypothetical protein